MKKHTLKKTVALIMAATMMFSVVGCGKKESKSKTEKKDTKNMVYEGEELALEGIEGEVSTFFVKGDRIYLNTYEWVEKASGEEKEETEASEEEMEAVAGTDIVRLYSMNLDGSDLKELPLPEFSKNEYMNYMSVNTDESILMLISSYDEKSSEQSFGLCKIDKDGKELFKEDITKSLNINPEQSYISQMLCDEKGRIILATENEVFVFDENVKLLGSVKADFYIEGMAKTKEGKIICAHSDEKEGAVVQELDIDGKKWGKVQKVDVSYWGGIGSLMDGMDYDFYYRQDSGVFGYDLKENKATQLMDFVASNMTSGDSWGIIPVAKDKFLGTSYEDGAEGMKLMIYSKVDPSTITDKKTITFGTMYADDSIKKAAIAFNKQSKDYQIEFVTYEDEEDPTAKMNAEIAAGNIPDIIDLSVGCGDMYAAKGLLEDLLPYIEKDKDLSTEDFLPTVFEAMKTGDKLYAVSPSFSVTTLVGRTKEVGKEIGWTFEDMKALIEEKKPKASPFYDNYKTNLLWSFAYTFDDFVDWQTGECTFDSKEFKDILELCNTGENGEAEYTGEERDFVGPYHKGEVLFYEGFVRMEEMQLYKELFNEDFTFIGYPDKDKSGSYFQFNQQLGISAKSENKEAAWEFIRTIMTKEYQGKQGNLYDTPVRKDAFDMMVKAKTTTKEYTDEFGDKVEPLSGGFGIDNLMVETKPLSKEEVAKYEELINNTHKKSNYDYKILEIIQEEVKAYFAGEKDVNATADVIQSRVKTYVNENR